MWILLLPILFKCYTWIILLIAIKYFTEQMQNSGKCAGNELKIWTPTATVYPPLSILTYILMRILTKMPPHILKVTFYFLTMILVFWSFRYAPIATAFVQSGTERVIWNNGFWAKDVRENRLLSGHQNSKQAGGWIAFVQNTSDAAGLETDEMAEAGWHERAELQNIISNI